jgi:hypothetical protein
MGPSPRALRTVLWGGNVGRRSPLCIQECGTRIGLAARGVSPGREEDEGRPPACVCGPGLRRPHPPVTKAPASDPPIRLRGPHLLRRRTGDPEGVELRGLARRSRTVARPTSGGEEVRAAEPQRESPRCQISGPASSVEPVAERTQIRDVRTRLSSGGAGGSKSQFEADASAFGAQPARSEAPLLAAYSH